MQNGDNNRCSSEWCQSAVKQAVMQNIKLKFGFGEVSVRRETGGHAERCNVTSGSSQCQSAVKQAVMQNHHKQTENKMSVSPP